MFNNFFKQWFKNSLLSIMVNNGNDNSGYGKVGFYNLNKHDPYTFKYIGPRSGVGGLSLYARNLLFNFIPYVDNGNSGIIFGTGTAAPTSEDTMLEDIITDSSITYNFVSNSYRNYQEGDYLCGSIDYTINNPTDSDLILREFGIINNVYASNNFNEPIGTTYDREKGCMLTYRSLIDPAIVIPSGESKTIRVISKAKYTTLGGEES